VSPSDIHIFRAGTHTTSQGVELTFSEADLTATASAYDPAVHEAPVVVGHPKEDAPAYGWVSRVTTRGADLFASLKDVNVQFAEQVKAGAYRKISAAFYPPDHPSNPKPGVWSLRHVGFLGAQPPAVRGLRPVQFADAGDGTVDVTVAFAAPDRDPLRDGLRRIADLFRQLVENPEAAVRFAEPAPIPAPDKETPVTTDTTDAAAREADLKKRAEALAAQEAEFAERQREHRSAQNAAFVEGLVKEGRVRGADQDGLVALLGALDTKTQVAAFAEGDGKTGTADAWVRRWLASQPELVEFGEVAGADRAAPGAGEVTFAAPPGYVVSTAGAELHARAKAYQQAHPDVDFMTAVRAVGGK